MKGIVCKIFIAVSILLILAFFIFTVVDYSYYDPLLNSAPFSAYILVRALQFLLPSCILFLLSYIVKGRRK